MLSLLALALAFVTQTEVQVGANERSSNRTFYAADSGVGVAAAEALARGRYQPSTVILNETSTGIARVADRIDVAPLAPILTVRCDWCPANDDGVPEFWKVHHAATATAERVAWTGAGPPPADARVLGSKTVERDVRVSALADAAGRVHRGSGGPEEDQVLAAATGG